MSVPGPAEPVDPRSVAWLTPAAVVERTVALGVSFLLLKSALAHVGNSYFFLSSVYSYQLTGPEVGKWVAVVLPFLQLVVAGCVLLRWQAREAYFLAGLMFVAFVAVQVAALGAGLEISCGCFGTLGSGEIGTRTLSLAGGGAVASFLGLALAGWSRPKVG